MRTPGVRIRRLYDHLRTRYYLEDDSPDHRIPPPSSELRWVWLSRTDSKVDLAQTIFDGRDPFEVRINPEIRNIPRVLTLVLLHELAHMRNSRARCTPADPWWKGEHMRLAAIGAFTREVVF